MTGNAQLLIKNNKKIKTHKFLIMYGFLDFLMISVKRQHQSFQHIKSPVNWLFMANIF